MNDSAHDTFRTRMRWLLEEYDIFFAGHLRATRRLEQLDTMLCDAEELVALAASLTIPAQVQRSVDNMRETLLREREIVAAVHRQPALVAAAHASTACYLVAVRHRRLVQYGTPLVDDAELDAIADAATRWGRHASSVAAHGGGDCGTQWSTTMAQVASSCLDARSRARPHPRPAQRTACRQAALASRRVARPRPASRHRRAHP